MTPLTSGADVTQNFGSYFTAGQLDVGDAPAPYPVATATIVRDFHLGHYEDTDGPPSADPSNQHDQNGVIDEDGVVFNTPLIAGQQATITVTVTSGATITGQDLGFSPNSAPIAAATSYTTAEDTTLTTPSPGVLAHATDANGDPLTAALVSTTAHGALTFNPDGSFTYTPAANYFGTDQFTYVANDGTDNSATATVTLDVTPVNDPPVFDPIADQTTDEGTNLSFAIHAVDPDPAPLNLPIRYSLASGAPNGATINPTTGVFHWNPSLMQGPGTYNITVDATEDGPGGLTTSKTFAITVNNVVPHDPTSFYVASLYQDTLGRPADPAGLQGWVDVLLSGAATPQQVEAAFLGSFEYHDRAIAQLVAQG